MISASHRMGLLVALLCCAAGAEAQQAGSPAVTVVAVPPLSTPDDKQTSAGGTLSLAWEASKLIAQDLRTTSEIMPLPPAQKDYYSYPEVTAPSFPNSRSAPRRWKIPPRSASGWNASPFLAAAEITR